MASGFTLLEMLIVVFIVGILASFAWPSYQGHITKARRNDGKTALMDLAGKMERYYAEMHTYQDATIATATSTDVLASPFSPEGWYQLTITASGDSFYSLQAIPVKAQATADTQCQALTLTDKGQKGITAGPAGVPRGKVENCW